tara:strand:+ start:28 stop:606 length:579 start_codon:yes stop_codon:yes gene_type:complete
MKRVFLLFLCVSAFSTYAQLVPTKVEADVKITTQEKQSYSQQANERKQAQALQAQALAAQAQARAATAAAMSPQTTEIVIPLKADLNSFTHIAVIDTYSESKSAYNSTAESLRSGPFIVVNPVSDRKKFRADRMYLRAEKHPEWLYLYFTKNIVGVDANRVLVIRDYTNRVIYKSKNINVPFDEVLTQILDF